MKRAFDLLAATAGLVLLLPVLVLTALCIKLDSRGPVFFRQKRVGRDGAVFLIYKFRTMVAAADTLGPQVTRDRDPRITAVGGVLRRVRLDELPQLINVLTGDMSIVGPRPEVPDYVAHYPEEIRRKVLSVRPGITNEALLALRDEDKFLALFENVEKAYLEKILPIKLEYYLDYVDHHTLAGDFRTILRTLIRVAIPALIKPHPSLATLYESGPKRG